MRLYNKVLFLLLVCVTAWTACKPTDYKETKAKELASGVRYDSLFLGYYIGMSRGDFYQHSLLLNSQGVVTNGTENSSVLFVIKDGYKNPIHFNFYPDFADEKIYRMRVFFTYEAWAPWNKQFFADQLVPDAVDYLEKLFGKGFVKTTSPKGLPCHAKINGNREIILTVFDEQKVFGTITDLTVTPPPPPKRTQEGAEGRPLWEKAQQQ